MHSPHHTQQPFDTLIQRARTFRDRATAHPESPFDFRQLADGQSPHVLFITCSDSRVVPALITNAAPGELFELRTAGNTVPLYRPDRPSGEAATIEYAVEVLTVADIVVCGHSHCGAVGAVVRRDDLATLPVVEGWLTSEIAVGLGPVPSSRPDQGARPGGFDSKAEEGGDVGGTSQQRSCLGEHRRPTTTQETESPGHASPAGNSEQAPGQEKPGTASPCPEPEVTDPEVTDAVQRHVLAQLERLRTYPGIQRRVAEGQMRLHAWFYEIHTGTVLAHRPEAGTFLPL